MERLRAWGHRAFVERYREMRDGRSEVVLAPHSPASLRWRTLLMSFGGFFMTLVLAGVGMGFSEEMGFTPARLWALVVLLAALVATTWFGADQFSRRWVNLYIAFVTLVHAGIVIDANDEYAGYLAVAWIAFGASIALGNGLDRAGWAHLAWISVTSFGAMVLAGSDAPGVSVVGWLALVASVVVVSVTIDRLVTQTRGLAVAERVAREGSERVSVELAEVSRHKSEFLAGMSHELRTPLNAIIGFSEVLDRRLPGELNERQGRYVGDIVESGRHLLALINDVLDLAKVEAGRMELSLGVVDLRSVLDGGVTMVRERAVRGGVELVLEVPVEVSVVADARKVKQVVVNLLSNAVKFTPPGGRVTVRGEALGGGVRVSVADSGPGIERADQVRIFEEFAQAGAGPTRAQEGTGLGLALARSLVELHGGRIGVESVPGQGATFTFTLPDQPDPTHDDRPDAHQLAGAT